VRATSPPAASRRCSRQRPRTRAFRLLLRHAGREPGCRDLSDTITACSISIARRTSRHRFPARGWPTGAAQVPRRRSRARLALILPHRPAGKCFAVCTRAVRSGRGSRVNQRQAVAFEFQRVTVVRAGRRVLEEVTARIPAAGITPMSGQTTQPHLAGQRLTDIRICRSPSSVRRRDSHCALACPAPAPCHKERLISGQPMSVGSVDHRAGQGVLM